MFTTGKTSILLLGLILLSISEINGQLCKGHCGETFEKCSCHATCESLLSCCGDYRQSCIQISPYSGTMMGGTVFSILNASFHPSKPAQLTCRFRGEIETVGFTDGDGQGYCVSPLLFQSGWVPFEVSTDGQTYNSSGEFLSVHPSKMDAEFKVTLVNSTQWQYYGTPNTAATLRMTWTSSLVRAEAVNIELWGYNEVNTTTAVALEAASAPLRAEWTYLYSLGRGVVNSGSFSFIPKPSKKPYSDWEVGSVRVSSSSHTEGARNVQAVWSGAHALAWHLEEAFRQDSAGWALDRCLSWDALEESLPNFLEEIVDCPCTLAQARADSGRFHTDYGCDIEKGSVCTYHPGAVHCVRAIQASPKYRAGQQCCYDHTGSQILTGDSIGGSTPDRAHDWGSPPYGSPPRIPGLSHWMYDVLTFYYCCLWSDHCHTYFRHRPSSGCRGYHPPRAGAVLGDPHIVTFDGLNYTFNGKGEYYLVQSPDTGLTVQGRTEQVTLENGTLAKATRLSAVAMRENTSDVIEVRRVPQQDHLEVLRNQQALSFTEQTWMDLHGVFLYSPTPWNVTVMFSSGVGVEVRGREGGAMALTVLLPTDYANHTKGLLGQMNFDPSDDLRTSLDEVILPDKASPEDIFNFGAGWKTSNETSLFTYDSKLLLDTYYHVKHDPAFIPAFSVVEDPADPFVLDMLSMCFGEGAEFCKFDTLTTRSLVVGNSTLMSFQSHKALLHDLLPVVSCGWLATPRNGEKEGTQYLEGALVSFTCKSGYGLFGSKERTCLPNGEWSGEETYCLSENILGVVLGTVFSIATLITMWVMISLHYRKQNRTRQNRMEAKVIFEQS